jgi:hypothetical protein
VKVLSKCYIQQNIITGWGKMMNHRLCTEKHMEILHLVSKEIENINGHLTKPNKDLAMERRSRLIKLLIVFIMKEMNKAFLRQ